MYHITSDLSFFNLLLFSQKSVVVFSGLDHLHVLGPPCDTDDTTDSETDGDVDDDLSLHNTCDWCNSHCSCCCVCKQNRAEST